MRAGACGVLEQRPLQPPRVVCLHQPLTLRPTHLEGGGLVSKRPVRIATTLCRVRGAIPTYRWLSLLTYYARAYLEGCVVESQW